LLSPVTVPVVWEPLIVVGGKAVELSPVV